MLAFYFVLNVDKLGAFGNSSRDLTKYIQYRVPHIYRNNSTLQEHCQLFSNAIASVVLQHANQTPFRREYSGTFRTEVSFICFLLLEWNRH